MMMSTIIVIIIIIVIKTGDVKFPSLLFDQSTFERLNKHELLFVLLLLSRDRTHVSSVSASAISTFSRVNTIIVKPSAARFAVRFNAVRRNSFRKTEIEITKWSAFPSGSNCNRSRQARKVDSEFFLASALEIAAVLSLQPGSGTRADTLSVKYAMGLKVMMFAQLVPYVFNLSRIFARCAAIFRYIPSYLYKL